MRALLAESSMPVRPLLFLGLMTAMVPLGYVVVLGGLLWPMVRPSTGQHSCQRRTPASGRCAATYANVS
jgi:hypothetical protein